MGCIVVATGALPFTPEGMYGYNGKNVITQIELEEKLRDGTLDAKRVVMIQCGRCQIPERTYCSRICCQTAIKNALTSKSQSRGLCPHPLSRLPDVRHRQRTDAVGISPARAIHYDVYDVERPPVVKDGVVEVYQPLLGEVEQIPFDLWCSRLPWWPPKMRRKLPT